jgi:hypothetical protein
MTRSINEEPHPAGQEERLEYIMHLQLVSALAPASLSALRMLSVCWSAESASSLLQSLPLMCADTILHFRHTHLLGTVRAAEETFRSFHAMSNDRAAAMHAARRQGMDRAFETIKHVLAAYAGHHCKTLVVLISTNFTASHGFLPTLRACASALNGFR